MGEIVTDTLSALWKVTLVGVLLGAGLPALFALGLRAFYSTPQVAADGVAPPTPNTGRAIGYLIFAVVALIALFGIVVIVFGKQLFAH